MILVAHLVFVGYLFPPCSCVLFIYLFIFSSLLLADRQSFVVIIIFGKVYKQSAVLPNTFPSRCDLAALQHDRLIANTSDGMSL